MSTFQFEDESNVDRLIGTLHVPTGTTGQVLTVNADKSISPAPGGGSVPGAAVVRGPFSFVFNTPGLADGVQVYVPTPGDLLLNAWIEVDVAFDGTTPGADIGTIDAGQWVDAGGFFYGVRSSAVDLSAVWGQGWSTDVLAAYSTTFFDDLYAIAVVAPGPGVVPARFITNAPLMLVASQDASSPGSTPLNSAAGQARLYIVTSTPVAL